MPMQILAPPQSSWARPSCTAIAGLSLCGITVAAVQRIRGSLECRRRRTATLHTISKAVRPTMQLVHTNTSVTTVQLKRTRRLRRAVLNMQPKGPGENDRGPQEQILNVLTCLPFVMTGHHLYRSPETAPGVKDVGSSLILAGGCAMLYHGVHPGRQERLRGVLRKLDHWTVSFATGSLLRAACPAQAARLRPLSLLVPYHPTAVTLANVGLVEAHLLRQVHQQPRLRGTYGRHAAALAAGGLCFAGESRAIAHDIGVVHSLWHCLAAVAVATGAHMLT